MIVLVCAPGLVEELRRLHHPAGDVGVAAALGALGRFGEGAHLLAELALLPVGLDRVHGQRDLGDDVLLAEAAALHSADRERVSRLQRAEQVVDHALRLGHFLRVGARGVDQHVDGLPVVDLRVRSRRAERAPTHAASSFAALIAPPRCRQSRASPRAARALRGARSPAFSRAVATQRSMASGRKDDHVVEDARRAFRLP